MAPRRLLALFFISGGFLYADSTTVTLPPKPEIPNSLNLTPNQQDAAFKKWRADETAKSNAQGTVRSTFQTAEIWKA